jgi:hypothetical protein
MYIGLHENYLLFLSDFNESRILSTDFRKIIRTPNLMKIRLVGPRVVPCGLKDKHGDANNRVSQNCETRREVLCQCT